MSRRVLVTGLGAVSSAGLGVQALWEAIRHGPPRIGPISGIDLRGLRVAGGAEVPARLGHEDRAFRLGQLAAEECLGSSGLDLQHLDRSRVGVAIGTTKGGIDALEAYMKGERQGRSRKSLAGRLLRYPTNAMGARLARRWDLQGPGVSPSSACASGILAIGLAFDLIRSGRADAMLAGGADALSAFALSGFVALGLVSEGPVRPFALGRSGMAIGEGAGLVLLEEAAAAERRGVRARAEILGFGLSSDAYDLLRPLGSGEGMARAIEMALADAGAGPQEVDFVMAHGTGSPRSDRMEARAFGRALGLRAATVPVVSIKGVVGHTMGASGALNTVAAVASLEGGCLPPTVGFDRADPDCPLHVSAEPVMDASFRRGLVVTAAMGGGCAALLLGREE